MNDLNSMTLKLLGLSKKQNRVQERRLKLSWNEWKIQKSMKNIRLKIVWNLERM